jgi:hypothetical protein|tara:strand:- start:177 stop:437 length:261 start_codon:yes stop_codon:yes gene_type:complete
MWKDEIKKQKWPVRFQLSQGVKGEVLAELEEIILKLSKSPEVIKQAKEESDKGYISPEYLALIAIAQEAREMASYNIVSGRYDFAE